MSISLLNTHLFLKRNLSKAYRDAYLNPPIPQNKSIKRIGFGYTVSSVVDKSRKILSIDTSKTPPIFIAIDIDGVAFCRSINERYFLLISEYCAKVSCDIPLSLRILRLRNKCVFSSDIDKYAQTSYEANFGEKPAGDITKIKASEIPDFDILFGGFPCQAFSICGLRKGLRTFLHKSL